MTAAPIDPIGNVGGSHVIAPPLYSTPIDTGQRVAVRPPMPLASGVFIDERKHLGIGVADQALVKPTGDAIMSAIARGHAARSGLFVPPQLGVSGMNRGRAETDGDWSPRTLNPVQPAPLIASKHVIISDLAGNAGPLMGEVALQPLLDIQQLNKKGASNF